MAATGRIRRRLAAAIVVTALIPLLGAMFLADSMVRATAARFYRPEVGTRLDEALGLYRELAHTQKESLRYQSDAMAADPDLRAAARRGDRAAVEAALRRLLRAHGDLVALDVEDDDGASLGHVDRGRPIDDKREFRLDVERSLGDPSAPVLLAVFATDRARFDGLESMSAFVDQYGRVAEGRQEDERTYLMAFAVLLGVAIVLAIGVGTLLARGVSRRIAGLAGATKRVAGGDLSIRVRETGNDEIADLARAFNQMLVEVQNSRARIEYLQRVGVWQDMARRLAHEIKNPLTPIQLAMEEIHQRYDRSDDRFGTLLDDALDVVQAEVGTLRRLVGEFSDFARLPQAHLEPGDLAQLLRDQEALADFGLSEEQEGAPEVDVRFDVRVSEARALLDRQMMGRVIVNLVRNATQAVAGGRPSGIVRVSLSREGDFWVVDVDDDGPGVPEAMRNRIFDPYVTTKTEGTGLGLAIVKKIVVEHGGTIAATDSPEGGARIRMLIPAEGTAPSRAALVADHAAAELERPSNVGSEPRVVAS